MDGEVVGKEWVKKKRLETNGKRKIVKKTASYFLPIDQKIGSGK